MEIDALNLDFCDLNKVIKNSKVDVTIKNCYGQRFIGAGLDDKKITIEGTPGNALGSYLNGATIKVKGNAQDAVGNTMNEGTIIIDGNCGDALGYAMRGGKIFVRGNAGYRTGIHMKEYKILDGPHKRPVIVVGGKVGSFLGEYLAGGIIIVLGLGSDEIPVGNFTATGIHGGSIFIRYNKQLKNLDKQVISTLAQDNQLDEIKPILTEYADTFNINLDEILNEQFFLLKANVKNPYKLLYTPN